MTMVSRCGPEQYIKGFATFAADGQRKRKERRVRKKRRKEKDEGRQPRKYDYSVVLEEMGEPYSKSWKKLQLIQKVRTAREKQNFTAYLTTCPATTTIVTTATHQGTGPRRDFETAKTTSSSSQEQVLAADGNSFSAESTQWWYQ